jgi:hypothetical protein
MLDRLSPIARGVVEGILGGLIVGIFFGTLSIIGYLLLK